MTPSWPKDNPLSLQDICIEYMVDNVLSVLQEQTNSLQSLMDDDDLYIPTWLSDGLLRRYIDKHDPYKDCVNRVVNIFKDLSRTKLQHVCVKQTNINDTSVRILCSHPLVELDLSSCREITEQTVSSVTTCAKTLRALRFDESEHVFLPNDIPQNVSFSGDSDCTQPILNLPNLRYLSLHESLDSLTCLKPLINLHHLDISSCTVSPSDIHLLREMKHLAWLSLADVGVKGDATELYTSIAELKSIKHLDVSKLGSSHNRFVNEPDVLGNLVSSLPLLTSLDISGTSLAGIEPIQKVSHRLKRLASHEEDVSPCPIASLQGRYFEFLGLFSCSDSPCSRSNLPALRVTGDANEDQMLLALKVYLGRAVPISRVLNVLFDHYRESSFNDRYAVLDSILRAMETHKEDQNVQISGSATLFYIVKGEEKKFLTYLQKQRVIKSIVGALGEHIDSVTMLRNGCLTLCHFDIPQDIMFCYNELVRILIDIMKIEDHEDFVLRLCIFLLNSVACQIDHREKLLLGNMGLIQVMVKTIESRLNQQVCDEVTKCAWSTLWNVTDETSSNCEEFVELGGMDLFLRSIETFRDEPDLIRNTMGLMGNLAEVSYLRPRLMSPTFLSAFCGLLSPSNNGLEISYNAAGVLANIMADDDCRWDNITEPKRTVVQARMSEAVMSWDLKAERNINYRSFEPILKILRAYSSPESQLWAAWALCNLSLVYPHKYCKLIEMEGGVKVLTEVLKDTRLNADIKTFAKTTLETCERYSAGQIDMNDT